MHTYTRSYSNVKSWLQTPIVLYPRPCGWEGRLAAEQNWTPRRRNTFLPLLGVDFCSSANSLLLY